MWGIMLPILCVWFGFATYVFVARVLYQVLYNHLKSRMDSVNAEMVSAFMAMFWPVSFILIGPIYVTFILPIRAAKKFPDTASRWKKKWENRHKSVVQETELLAALGLDQPKKFLSRDQVIDALVQDEKVDYDLFSDFIEELRTRPR